MRLACFCAIDANLFLSQTPGIKSKLGTKGKEERKSSAEGGTSP